MLPAIRNFFDQFIASRPDETAPARADRARLAAAALLVEVMRSDASFSGEERAAVLEAVRRKFGLDPEAARQLVELAEAEARDAHDTYQFTSKINAGFSAEQKLGLVEELWRVAWSDATLHRHEEHLIRRVADLLHVPHRAFIRAKLRADPAIVKPEPSESG
jgi:uncharacterized tellurite resistance protein B-like protein